MKQVWIAALALVTFQLAHAGEVYRWVDNAGVVHYSDHAPANAVKKLEQRKLESNVIDGQGSYVTKDAATKNPVTLYAGDCGPLCVNAKNLLDKRGIPYAYKDPAKNKEDNFALEKLINGHELPVLKIGTNVVKGWEPNRWNQLLDEAGYPKTDISGGRKMPVNADKPAVQTKP
ncbi:MAG: glutaredoxin family protein [Sulfuriferula sp.]|nr:glutaredoxin family protein [Sulfuriferula sp.]